MGDPLLLRLVGFVLALAVPRSRFRSHCRSRSGSWAPSSCSSSGFCPFLAKKFFAGARSAAALVFPSKDRCRISRLKNSNNNKIGKSCSQRSPFYFFPLPFALLFTLEEELQTDWWACVRVRQRKKPWGRSELFHFHRRLFRYDLISFLLLLLLLRERRDFAGAELLLWM